MSSVRLYVARDRETGVLWTCMAGHAGGDRLDFWKFDHPEQCERRALQSVSTDAPALSAWFVEFFMGCAEVLRGSRIGNRNVTDFAPIKGRCFDLRTEETMRDWVRNISRHEGRSASFVQSVLDRTCQ